MYKQQISIDVIAVIRASCEPVLQSTSEHWEVHFSQTSVAMHFCWLTAYLTGTGVIIWPLHTSKAARDRVLCWQMNSPYGTSNADLMKAQQMYCCSDSKCNLV